MTKFGNILTVYYIIFHFCGAFKVPHCCERLVLWGGEGQPIRVPQRHCVYSSKANATQRIGSNVRSCYHNTLRNHEGNKQTKLFYRSKKEKDIQESGYMYPFDHLERKKKKFPPDPYQPTDEEREENTADVLDEELDDDELLSFDEDDDAKRHFGETTYNAPISGHSSEGERNHHDAGEAAHASDVDELIPRELVEEAENGSVAPDESQHEREVVKICVHSAGEQRIEAEVMKDQLYYLFHSSMDSAFIEFFRLQIESSISEEEKNTSVSYTFGESNYQAPISCVQDLINFSQRLQKSLTKRMEDAHREKTDEEMTYLSKSMRKELERGKKERNITHTSKRNLQMSIESSLKLIEKCKQNLYRQNYERTLHDLKLAYSMLPCKYYGFFLSSICANISMLSYYTNDMQGTFNFSLKAIKYEPKYALAWKCLGDAYRSFRKFWQARNFYDIAIHLGYKDDKGENFREIVAELNKLTVAALKKADTLKENMNNCTNVVVKKNIGIVLNKNPDSIGGCYVSYIIEGGKASKKNFHHGDQIVALNNIVTYGKPIDFCLKAFQKNEGSYDIVFFRGNIIELYGLRAYQYLVEHGLFHTLFENEKIASFKRNETILFDLRGFGTFSEYGVSQGG
ncbi:hypothetical protein C922_03937 [Plasmodium inui San Antonio 1]|uniref:PDZ domain-containing protein n=1 Tax=Plasmodium inui San Antonio 1 TaxID=1237626 RepID=W7A970_9APIC|nr:hypothetical protein C922_03937 [Plasmodium inui San Antonio 1]EUD65689.1 hypothetical protein C922_03937 [Plasmodium inui San Antonio 1]